MNEPHSRNCALEEAATVADKFAEANARLNDGADSPAAIATAWAIANAIRLLKS